MKTVPKNAFGLALVLLPFFSGALLAATPKKATIPLSDWPIGKTFSYQLKYEKKLIHPINKTTSGGFNFETTLTVSAEKKTSKNTAFIVKAQNSSLTETMPPGSQDLSKLPPELLLLRREIDNLKTLKDKTWKMELTSAGNLEVVREQTKVNLQQLLQTQKDAKAGKTNPAAPAPFNFTDMLNQAMVVAFQDPLVVEAASWIVTPFAAPSSKVGSQWKQRRRLRLAKNQLVEDELGFKITAAKKASEKNCNPINFTSGVPSGSLKGSICIDVSAASAQPAQIEIEHPTKESHTKTLKIFSLPANP